MNLCDITMFWSPSGGGVRRYLERKTALLEQLRCFRHLLVTPAGQASMDTTGSMTRAEVRSPGIPFSPGYRMPLRIRATVSLLDSWKPDLVESGCPFSFRKAVSRWAGESGKPVFDYYHAYFPLSYTAAVFGPRFPLLRRALETVGWSYLKSTYADSRRIFVASPVVRDVLSSHGLENTELAPLGVDIDLFRPGEEARETGRPLILFVGRLSREKGLETVLETHELLSGRIGSRLMIAGDGILRPRVEELASTDPGITYAGFLSNVELASVFRRADLLLSAAPAETMGLTFLEALASGIPVVGLSGSGLMDSFPAEIATAVGQATSEALAGAVVEMLGRRPDRRSCRAYAEGFSWPSRLGHILRRELEIAGHPIPSELGEIS